MSEKRQGMKGHLKNDIRKKYINKYGFFCYYCHAPLNEVNFQYEHIIPYSIVKTNDVVK